MLKARYALPSCGAEGVGPFPVLYNAMFEEPAGGVTTDQPAEVPSNDPFTN